MTEITKYVCDVCEEEFESKKDVESRYYFVGTSRCEIEGRTYDDRKEVHVCVDCKDLVPYPTTHKIQQRIANTIFKGKGRII